MRFIREQGGEIEKTRLTATSLPLHPSLRRAFEDEISPIFETLLVEQGWLDNAESWSKVLDLLPDEDLRETLATKVRMPSRGFLQLSFSSHSMVDVDEARDLGLLCFHEPRCGVLTSPL